VTSPSNKLPWTANQVQYQITVTNNTASVAMGVVVRDYLFKTVGTPVFTATINPSGAVPFACSSTNGSVTACGTLPTFSPLIVNTNNLQQLFTVPIEPSGMMPNETVTITYTVQYDPVCETDPNLNDISNYAQAMFNGTPYAAQTDVYYVEFTACQLSVCKLNFDDTIGNPSPSPADCTKPGPLPLAYLTFPTALAPPPPPPPVQTQTFTIFYQNLATAPMGLTVGTVRDSVAVCTDPTCSAAAAAYGTFPISYSYACDFLPLPPTFPAGAAYSGGPTTAMPKWNNPAWAGVRTIDLSPAVFFPVGSTLLCKLTVSTLTAAQAAAPPLNLPSNLPTGCLNAGLPVLENSALMDLSLTSSVTYNSSTVHPNVFGQASVYLPLCQNVAVTKQMTQFVGVGQTDVVTITAKNDETIPVSGFMVTDPLPPGFSYDASFVLSGCTPMTCPGQPTSTSPVKVIFPTILAGQSETFTFRTTAPLAGGPFANPVFGAFAPLSNCTPICDPAGFFSKGSLAPLPFNGQVVAPLLTKVFGTPSTPITMAAIGVPITLTFVITNVPSGPTFTGIGFTDTLPSGLSYVPGSFSSPTCGGTGVFSPAISPTMFTYSNGTLSSATCTITVRVVATSCGSFTNDKSNFSHVTYLDATGVSAMLNVPCIGHIEICKASAPINPVPSGTIYNFIATGSAFSSPPGLQVPVGECSGPIPVTSGTTTITELMQPGAAVYTITTDGYSPPPLSQQVGNALLVSADTQTGIATAIVQPDMPGRTSLETIVTYTNYEAPPAQLKLCKVAGPGVAVGTSFNFTLPPSTVPIPVEAGPVAEGGFCVIVAGTFQVGTPVPVAEAVPANHGAPAITVNGVAATTTTSGGCAATPACVLATIGAGFNEVSFTNSCTGPRCPAPSGVAGGGIARGEGAGGGIALPNLVIVNYSLVSQVASTGTRSYMTYRADMLNTGMTPLGPVIARLTSLDSTVEVVGQGELNFAPMPDNSQVASSNTFTILTDRSVPLDFSKLSWEYYSRRSVPPRRAATR